MKTETEEKVLLSFGVIPPDAEVIEVSEDVADEDNEICEVTEITKKELGGFEKWPLRL